MLNGIQNTRIEEALSGTGFSDFVRRGAGADTVNRCRDTLSLQPGSGGSRHSRRAEVLTGAVCRQTMPHRARFFSPSSVGGGSMQHPGLHRTESPHSKRALYPEEA